MEKPSKRISIIRAIRSSPLLRILPARKERLAKEEREEHRSDDETQKNAGDHIQQEVFIHHPVSYSWSHDYFA
jgi:hypothetical protein